MKRTIYVVRSTTTQSGAELSFGADLALTTTTYAFADKEAAVACLDALELSAEGLRMYPGVKVEVEFTTEEIDQGVSA